LAGPQRTLCLLLRSALRRGSGFGTLYFEGTRFILAAAWRRLVKI